MSNFKYKTIANLSEGTYKEKGSKFFAFAYPIQSEDEVKEIVQLLRQKHHQAVHVCSAYRLFSDKRIAKYSDDGEPSNSAGPPIMGQIRAFDLTNILIAVVRYYGGVNLGVGGLINAYKTASKEALESAQIIEKEDQIHYTVSFQYAQMSFVMNQLKQLNAKITTQETNLSCEISFLVPASTIQVEEKLTDQNHSLIPENKITVENHGIIQ
jgi:uncharacterized YigZ family protein